MKINGPEIFPIISKPKFNLEQMYSLYGYKPYPEGRVVGEKKKLNFVWSTEQISAINDATRKVLEKAINRSYFYNTEIIKFNNDVIFKVKCSKSEESFKISIQLFVSNEEVADFVCLKDFVSGNFVLRHRFVDKKYRGQEIGSKMLSLIEQAVQIEVEKQGKKQIIEIDARQLGIINFALKNGYTFSSEKDKENFELICEGNRNNFLIATAPKADEDNIERYGFIYPIENLKKIGKEVGMGELTSEEIWKMDINDFFSQRTYLHGSQALLVRFVKEKNPVI